MASEQREEPLQGQTEAGVEDITASVKEIMLKNDDEYVGQYLMILALHAADTCLLVRGAV